MYSKYVYLSGATQANVLSDVVAIFTGETNVNNLSASCDKVNSTISVQYDVAGWEMHDAAAGTNRVVLKAACDGDAAQFKYMLLDTNSANTVIMTLYEGWNNVSHVGTNGTYGGTTVAYNQRWSNTATGALHISASARRAIMYGASAIGNGNSNAAASTAIVEFDRGYSWCAVGQGFLPAADVRTSPSGFGTWTTRHRDKNGNIQTSSSSGSSSFHAPIMTWSFSGDNQYGNGVPTDTGFTTPVLPFTVYTAGNSGSASFSGTILADMWGVLWGTAFDDMIFNGKTYIVLPSMSSGGSSGKLIVPKG